MNGLASTAIVSTIQASTTSHWIDAFMADRPASRAFAKALARGDRFVGQFALPGLVPEEVKRDGRIVQFSTEAEATAAAERALAQKMSSRRVETKRKGEYTRMSGEQLAVALARANMNPHTFARVYGVPQARVIKWIDGEQEIPHVAAVFVRLMVEPDNRRIAEEVTQEAMKED